MKIEKLKYAWFMVVVLVLAGMFLMSCGPTSYFVKPNATDQDFLKDKYECSKEASQYMYNIRLSEKDDDYNRIFQEQWCTCMGVKQWKLKQSETPCKGCFDYPYECQ